MNETNYNIPANLLTTNNSKTIKGNGLGYITYIMYLAPHTQNSKGINLCSHASKGCAKACLFNSGAARFDRVQQGKINKTEYFLADRKSFMLQIHKELISIEKKFSTKDEIPVIRLNGTADIPFEKFKVIGNKNIFELHPNLQFYDYTKNPIRMTKEQPSNYHLTFSMSEDNKPKSFELLDQGKNVAVVFAIKNESELPLNYGGYNVINGDENDLRFLDPINSIVGLKYKLMTGKGTKGVNAINMAENDFLIHLN